VLEALVDPAKSSAPAQAPQATTAPSQQAERKKDAGGPDLGMIDSLLGDADGKKPGGGGA
jgi:hypothetical protein